MLKFDLTISARAERVLGPLFGFLSGFLNGMTNAAGPTLAIYLYGLKLEKRMFVKPQKCANDGISGMFPRRSKPVSFANSEILRQPQAIDLG
jgi:hypothetical protein